MAGDLAGKRAFVTGANSGIGRAIAETFAAAGASVAVHGRSLDRLGDTLAAIESAGGTAIPVTADLRDRNEIKAMCADTLEKLGGVDIVMNNAGVAWLAPLVDTEEEMWDATLAINMTACFLVTKALLPAMIAQGTGGRLLYTSSVSGKEAEEMSCAYNASKAGITLFAKCLAREVGPKGITVNSICPGWIDTKMAVEIHEEFAKEQKRDYDELFKESMSSNMMGVIQSPQDIADCALFLAGDGGKHITGQAINVCAGMSTV